MDSNKKIIVGGIVCAFLAITALTGAANTKGSNLTPEQKLEITNDCIQNPDALRCQ